MPWQYGLLLPSQQVNQAPVWPYIVTLAEVKAHSGVSFDDHDELITRILAGAQRHVERQLGYRLAAKIEAAEGDFADGVPADLALCVCQLAAHWYGNREASAEARLESIPFGVEAIVNEYREWSF